MIATKTIEAEVTLFAKSLRKTLREHGKRWDAAYDKGRTYDKLTYDHQDVEDALELLLQTARKVDRLRKLSER